MGAFFLYKKETSYNIEEVKKVFSAKHFNHLIHMEIDDWELFLYPKMVSGTPFVYKEGKSFLAVIGSATYKDYKSNELLEHLYEDIRKDVVDYSELQGHFTLIWNSDDLVNVMMDSLVTKHVFAIDSYDFFSSSLLACCYATNSLLHIDKKSLCEKAMTGIILSPDTIFKEIKSIDSSLVDVINEKQNGINLYIPLNDLGCKPQFQDDFSLGVEEQIQELDRMFLCYQNYAEDNLVDTGLSAGYDSRLVFSYLNRFFPQKVHTHTHNTLGVHEKEGKIAIEIAKSKGVICETIPTFQLDKVEDLESLIKENIFFFDGRNSFVIGGINQTYTTNYRKRVTNEAPVTFTGMGGEIYRNYYHIVFRKKPLQWYLDKKVICKEYYSSIMNKSLRDDTKRRFEGKLEKRLKSRKEDMKGFHFFRRYYSEIMMPEGQGVVLDAYNQVSDCFAPFISCSTIRKSYENMNLIGIDGSFEAAMINKTDHQLALIQSTYGHNMMSLSKPFLAKQYMKAFIPETIWNAVGSMLPRNRKGRQINKDKEALENSRYFIEAMDYFSKLVPEINTHNLFNGKYEFKNMSFIICTIYMLKDKIED